MLRILFLIVGWLGWQQVPPITAENVMTLESVYQIDFADSPSEVGEIGSGWLRVSPDGSHLVTINRANDLLLWQVEGDLQAVYQVEGTDGTNANMLDAAFSEDGTRVLSLHNDGANYSVASYTLATDDLRVIIVPVGDDLPVRVWAADAADEVWVEVMTNLPDETPYVLRVSLDDGAVLEQLPSAPEADEQAVVRIGRMPAPLAVTSTETGLAQLWDLETGDLVSDAQVNAMPMFGHINDANTRRLAWRDPMSENLYLLDFDGGENTLVAPLDGRYVQALLIGAEGDVILGVNIDLEPVILAWDVAGGEETTLGSYRECNRTPDMVQLSDDGTTLVIGCDTGIDVWQIR